MFTNFPFFPQQASEQAVTVDALYFFLVAVTGFFALLIAVLVVVFAMRVMESTAESIWSWLASISSLLRAPVLAA